MAKPPDDEPPENRIHECNDLLKEENWLNLQNKANNLITDYPDSDIGWYFRGISLAELNEHQKAILLIKAAID